MMDANEFLNVIETEFGRLSDEASERFRDMAGLYREWNAKINVISRKDIDSLYSRHILHSLAIAVYLKRERPGVFEAWNGSAPVSVLDLGTGGGFPGIPLAVMFPSVQFVLCDSVGKKTLVAQNVAEVLGLSNVTVVNTRAESLTETFDHVVSRAVTSLDNFYPWVAGKYRRCILYLKGGDCSGELARMLKLAGLHNDDARIWRISTWLDDPVFEEKYVIDIPAGKALKGTGSLRNCRR